MAITLQLRHLWTATGGPVSWTFDGSDERDLRDLLTSLDEFKADPERRSAVLVATEDDGTVIGAWNRDGAGQLRTWIEAIPRGPGWMEIRHALDDAVTGP